MKEYLQLIVPALIGGVVDYANQVIRGLREFQAMELFVHLLSAAFFGWMIGTTASGLGHVDSIVAAAGGLGGFLGVRIADIIVYKFKEHK